MSVEQPHALAERGLRVLASTSPVSPFPRTLGSEAAANTVQFNERIVIPSAKDEVGTDLEGIRVY